MLRAQIGLVLASSLAFVAALFLIYVGVACLISIRKQGDGFQAAAFLMKWRVPHVVVALIMSIGIATVDTIILRDCAAGAKAIYCRR